jgi:hypothetical protein
MSNTPHSSNAVILTFFESPYQIKKFDVNDKEIAHDNWVFVCKYCKKMGIKNRQGGVVGSVSCHGKVYSNLKKHLNVEGHEQVHEEYKESINEELRRRTDKVRKRSVSPTTPSNAAGSKSSKMTNTVF